MKQRKIIGYDRALELLKEGKELRLIFHGGVRVGEFIGRDATWQKLIRARLITQVRYESMDKIYALKVTDAGREAIK